MVSTLRTGNYIKPGARSRRWALLLAVICTFSVAGANAQRPAPTPARPEATPPPPDINFTPTLAETDSDGFLAKVIVFKVGTKPAHAGLPAGWVAAGSSNELYLTNPKLLDARITVRVSSLEPPPKLDERWIESVKPLVLASLPKDGQNMIIANVTANVLNINEWQSVEIKTSIDRIGRRFSTGWIFVRFANGRLLEVIFTGTDDKFPAIRAAAVDVMKGWGDHIVPKTAPGR